MKSLTGHPKPPSTRLFAETLGVGPAQGFDSSLLVCYHSSHERRRSGRVRGRPVTGRQGPGLRAPSAKAPRKTPWEPAPERPTRPSKAARVASVIRCRGNLDRELPSTVQFMVQTLKISKTFRVLQGFISGRNLVEYADPVPNLGGTTGAKASRPRRTRGFLVCGTNQAEEVNQWR